MVQKDLINIYHLLLSHFGFQNWWPGQTQDEIIIGAILTQGVSWQNVEKAINNLKQHHLCSLEAIDKTKSKKIAKLIKPALYFNRKAMKLKVFAAYLSENFSGNLGEMMAMNLKELRTILLGLKGIGPETADSIILYAAKKPIFVVDAYTKRIFSRIGIIKKEWKYDKIQLFCQQNLLPELTLFQDFHAQIVKLGKEHCRKHKPVCHNCPISCLCDYGKSE